MEAEEERLRGLLVRYIEVVERAFKGKPAGIPKEQVRVGCLYVLDWLPERPDRFDGVKVEQVDNITDNTVEMPGSTTDLDTFASLVVGGPFSLE